MKKLLTSIDKRSLAFALPASVLGLLIIVTCSNSEVEYDTSDPQTSTFTDSRDGKVYKTVQVGDQWIMAENFAYKPGEGNYWAYEDNDSNVAIYGYLYDWETAMKAVPDGWHLPSREEWFAIEKILGAKRGTFPYLEKIYPKLLPGGSSGLNMLFGGMRTCSGKFIFLGEQARFWNSDDKNSEKATYGLDSNKDSVPHGLRRSIAPYVYHNGYQKACPAYSIRLIKDS